MKHIVAIEVDELPKDYLVAWINMEAFDKDMENSDMFETIKEKLTEEQKEYIKEIRLFVAKTVKEKHETNI